MVSVLLSARTVHVPSPSGGVSHAALLLLLLLLPLCAWPGPVSCGWLNVRSLVGGTGTGKIFFSRKSPQRQKTFFLKKITSESIRPEPCCSARTSLCALIWSKCSEFLLECPGLCRRVPSFYRNVLACARLSYDFALMFQVFHGFIWMFSCLPIFFRVFFVFLSRQVFRRGGNAKKTGKKHEENTKKTQREHEQ